MLKKPQLQDTSDRIAREALAALTHTDTPVFMYIHIQSYRLSPKGFQAFVIIKPQSSVAVGV